MAIFAIADLHLAVSTPDKKMDVFGGAWVDYMQKIEERWREAVREGDLVLIAGDISWAMKLVDAIGDLEWIDRLPGTKVMIRGNHDLWWGSISQVRSALPPSLHVIQNDIFRWQDVEIGGARLWDTPEYHYQGYVEFQENPKAKKDFVDDRESSEKIFVRELLRLETSLKLFKGSRRIAMVHYPPIGPNLAPSRASALLEKYRVQTCVFGHIHQVRLGSLPLGEARGVTYRLTSADYLDFHPLLLQ